MIEFLVGLFTGICIMGDYWHKEKRNRKYFEKDRNFWKDLYNKKFK